jgi:hypothetical protein
LLRSQHERLLEWSRSGKARAAGLQLLEDISTSAGLLRDINRRQELRAHDTAMIRALLANPPTDHRGWLPSLERLVGLDDPLDALTTKLAATLNAPPATDLHPSLEGKRDASSGAELDTSPGGALSIEILARLSLLA